MTRAFALLALLLGGCGGGFQELPQDHACQEVG